jgi:hypothetical protein
MTPGMIGPKAPWAAFDGTNSLAVDHFGNKEVEPGPANKCCVTEPGLATDGADGDHLGDVRIAGQ